MSRIKLVAVILICIFLLPFMVNAEECNPNSIKLKSIKAKEKSEYTEELTEATIDNNKINLDLKMYDVGDYIEYTLKVKNESNDDFYFDENSLNINSNYFDYSLSYKDNSNKIEPNTEKTIYLRVQYKKEVEKENFFSGKYIDKNNLVVNLSNTNPVFTNPLTKNIKITLILGLLLIIQVLLYFKWEKRNNKNYLLLLGLTLLIPISTYALCTCNLELNSNITIGKVKPNPCTYDGELIQGAEFINGQYTYRYMQEYDSRVDRIVNGINYYKDGWYDLELDGWGVILTDKDSTDDVTTKLCTSINDKPIVTMNYMFYTTKASKIDLSSFDTSNVYNMNRMFAAAYNVVEYDLSSFDTSKVKTMTAMFNYNPSLKSIDLRGFDITNTSNIDCLLCSDNNLENINMDNLNLTSFVNEYGRFSSSIFGGSNNIRKLSMKNWIIPEKFKNFSTLSGIYSSNNLEFIDVSGWNLSKTKDIEGVFEYLKAKDIKGLDTWNTSNVVNMNRMFQNNSNLTELDLSSFNTNNLLTMDGMFYGASELKTIYVSDKFKTDNVTNSDNMFNNTSLLVGGNGTVYDSSHTDKEYARIDTPEAPGYFTRK